MNIHNTIKKHLQHSHKEELASKLGYSSIKKATKALNTFLESEDLYSWLHSGYYDFKYTAEQLLRKICLEIGIDFTIVDIELQEYKKYYVEVQKLQNDYIFVNTNFRRTTQPVFVLALCESKRRIKLDAKKYVFKNKTEILELISKSVKQHYLSTKGTLGIWGKIENYIYHHKDKIFTFDTDGTKIIDDEVDESKATLSVKGKLLC